MGILLGYFLWVTSMLAIIVTAWIGVADSGVERVHLPRAATGRSYDASFMAANNIAPAATPRAQTAAASDRRAEARMPGSVAANTGAAAAERRPGRHVTARLNRSLGAGPRVAALRANPPPFDGH
jgi:hypothetical protein